MSFLGQSLRISVASPQLGSQVSSLDQLASLPILSTNDEHDRVDWHLEAADGRGQTIRVKPRLGCSAMDQLLAAEIADMGVAFLPDRVCRPALEAGRMIRVLPAWHGQIGIVHLAFTTRRGLSPAARALIEHLAKEFAPAIAVEAMA